MPITEQQLYAIGQIIFDSFSGDPNSFGSAMTKLKLQQELVAIESQITLLRDGYNTATDEFNLALEQLQANLAAKQAEIDALEVPA